MTKSINLDNRYNEKAINNHQISYLIKKINPRTPSFVDH